MIIFNLKGARITVIHDNYVPKNQKLAMLTLSISFEPDKFLNVPLSSSGTKLDTSLPLS